MLDPKVFSRPPEDEAHAEAWSRLMDGYEKALTYDVSTELRAEFERDLTILRTAMLGWDRS